MDGFRIILYPEDRAWVADPAFIRGLATLLGAERVEALWVFQAAANPAESPLAEPEAAEKILDRENVSVEEALTLGRCEPGFFTCLEFGGTPAFNAVMAAVGADLPEELSEGWVPLEASFCNGAQIHYRLSDGEPLDGSGCHLTLSNLLGAPVEMDNYLASFLQTEASRKFLQRLAELSSRQWLALIDLT